MELKTTSPSPELHKAMRMHSCRQLTMHNTAHLIMRLAAGVCLGSHPRSYSITSASCFCCNMGHTRALTVDNAGQGMAFGGSGTKGTCRDMLGEQAWHMRGGQVGNAWLSAAAFCSMGSLSWQRVGGVLLSFSLEIWRWRRTKEKA